ncbi:MAG: RloB family protein [Muribaculaceae bacterium]|nr:RloB family protein [Muribaculaceae bacterium]MDE6450341.1 RloB family protein [Muribaculaceae bacterium]
MVICEGETEKVYVEALRNHYRLPVTIKTKVSGNNINARLINQYITELGIDKDDDYSIFFIYDSDVTCVVEKLRRLKGTPILTNPCIELWYILHSCDHSRPVNSDTIVKKLIECHQAWKSYTKGTLTIEQRNILIQNHDKASARALKLNWPDNPSSNMTDFIVALEQSKKR